MNSPPAMALNVASCSASRGGKCHRSPHHHRVRNRLSLKAPQKRVTNMGRKRRVRRRWALSCMVLPNC